jgi:hypothetical protein
MKKYMPHYYINHGGDKNSSLYPLYPSVKYVFTETKKKKEPHAFNSAEISPYAGKSREIVRGSKLS